jgi:hypothetical protein
MEILRDKYGKLIIREIAGGEARLYDRAGHTIATYRSNPNYTCDNNGARIGSGDRLPGLVKNEKYPTPDRGELNKGRRSG